MYSLKISLLIFNIFGTVDFTGKKNCRVKDVVKIRKLNILFFKCFQNKNSTIRKQKKQNLYTHKSKNVTTFNKCISPSHTRRLIN